jgi:large subunit ribosomal protein L9
MQIILIDKVVNLGNLGDVVKVKDGYARNFLIPTGRARRATQANIDAFAVQKIELERAAATKLDEARARAAKLEGFAVKIAQSVGVDGRLFGSVTNADIAEALTNGGVEVAKAEVRLPDGPLKAIGDYPIVIGLYHDVIATVTVTVAGQN